MNESGSSVTRYAARLMTTPALGRGSGRGAWCRQRTRAMRHAGADRVFLVRLLRWRRRCCLWPSSGGWPLVPRVARSGISCDPYSAREEQRNGIRR